VKHDNEPNPSFCALCAYLRQFFASQIPAIAEEKMVFLCALSVSARKKSLLRQFRLERTPENTPKRAKTRLHTPAASNPQSLAKADL
jgi:hypothetical protein